MSDCVRISGGVVTKTVDPDLARIEVAKTRKAGEIAEACGLFSVPRVVQWDEAKGCIQFEFLPTLRTIGQVDNLAGVYKPLMRRIGQALAAIHGRLRLPDEMVTGLPPAYSLPQGEVFLHGDFCVGNVGLLDDGRLVIFDWQTTPKVGGLVTRGTRYFDVMWFLYSLFYRPIGRARYAMSVPAAPMAREFADGYMQACEGTCSFAGLAAYLDPFLRAREETRGNGLHLKRRLLLLPGRMQFRRFVRHCA